MSTSCQNIDSKLLKSSLSRPSLRRKHDQLEDNSLPSPGKRVKVTFDSDVSVRILGEQEKTLEFFRGEVRDALVKHASGDNSHYNHIKEIFIAKPKSEDEPSATVLQSYTLALLSNVASLDKYCHDLVICVLHSQWLGKQEEYATLFIRFLANLVSVHAVFLPDVLRMLVDNLVVSK